MPDLREATRSRTSASALTRAWNRLAGPSGSEHDRKGRLEMHRFVLHEATQESALNNRGLPNSNPTPAACKLLARLARRPARLARRPGQAIASSCGPDWAYRHPNCR